MIRQSQREAREGAFRDTFYPYTVPQQRSHRLRQANCGSSYTCLFQGLVGQSWSHLPPLSSFQPIYALVTSLMVGSFQLLSTTIAKISVEITTLLLFYLILYLLCHAWSLQDLSSPTRDWTQAPEVTVQSPDHWTAKEFPACLYLFRAYISVCLGGRWFQWPSSPPQGCQPGAHFPPEESLDFPSGLGESAVRDYSYP